MDVYSQMIRKIIQQQEAIIGPVAVEQAEQVPHLHVDWGKKEISIDGDAVPVVDDLVDRYQELFGQISVEVCRDAVASLLPQLEPDRMPQSLK